MIAGTHEAAVPSIIDAENEAQPWPELDLAAARRFFTVMAEGEEVTLQTFDDSNPKRGGLAQVMHGTFDDLAPHLVDLNRQGAGVYWMVNQGNGGGRKTENVVRVRALFLDLDGAPLGPVLAAAVEPHAVIETSPGKWHVYWPVRDCRPDQFKAAQQALALRFGGDMSVCDLPRVLRVPGFLHCKGEPFVTRIERLEPMQARRFDDLVSGLGLDLTAAMKPPRVEVVDQETGEIVDKVAAGGRHKHLAKRLADVNWRGISEAAIRVDLHEINQKECQPPLPEAEVDALVTDWLHRYRAQHARDLVSLDSPLTLSYDQRQASNVPAPEASSFAEVDLRGVHDVKPQVWWLNHYMPANEVTLLAAHGGTGKSTLALQLAVALALGVPFLGKTTQPARVLFLSAEDPAPVVMRRLRKIITAMGLDVELLRANLRVIDATEGEPALFAETGSGKGRSGATTPAYSDLKAYIDANEIDVVIADNASDLFDGDEINRAMVRRFISALRRLVRSRGGAVLLLSHVDKNTSKGNRGGPNTEGYSGSTAWHNSVRSRLFMQELKSGVLEIQHQKSNHGRKQEPIKLEWPDGGLPQLIVDSGGGDGLANGLQAGDDPRAILMLIHEFTSRGEFVAAGHNSPSNAYKLLSGDRLFPKRVGKSQVFSLLRDAQRGGLIETVEYQNVYRKAQVRWGLTAAGREWAGIAPTAPTAPTIEVGSDSAGGAVAAPTAPTAHGGYGGRARAKKSEKKSTRKPWWLVSPG